MTSAVKGYLGDLGRQLHLGAPQEREILYEIRDHIEDSAEDLVEEGIATDDALHSAIDRLGGPKVMASQLYAVHSTGSWYHTALAVLPHILLSLMFALGLKMAPLWLGVMLAVALVISVVGWRRGRPTWTYPWLGYCLVAPIVSWGLGVSAVGYGAWGVLTQGSLPLGVPIYLASFVYFAGSLWFVIRIVSRVAQRDSLIASLAVLPIPFLSYWSFYFYSNMGAASQNADHMPGVNASAAVVFLVLAVATALFFRIGRRVVRVALLAITAPSIIVLVWLSSQGGPGFIAVFSLAAMTIAILLGPAVLDRKSQRSDDYLSAVQDPV